MLKIKNKKHSEIFDAVHLSMNSLISVLNSDDVDKELKKKIHLALCQLYDVQVTVLGEKMSWEVHEND